MTHHVLKHGRQAIIRGLIGASLTIRIGKLNIYVTAESKYSKNIFPEALDFTLSPVLEYY